MTTSAELPVQQSTKVELIVNLIRTS